MHLILNNRLIHSDASPSMTLLDFIRYQRRLMGTKIGCREGDCGACTILIGKIKDSQVVYQTMTSCITPLGNAEGCHVVTIEGLNMDELSPVQELMVEKSGSQCGFCTPGFVVSMTNCCITQGNMTPSKIVQSIDGNICRCTGYFPMRRVAEELSINLDAKPNDDVISWAVNQKLVPAYFNSIYDRLNKIKKEYNNISLNNQVVAGGTDLYVQRHDDLHDVDLRLAFNDPSLKGIAVHGDQCSVGAGTTASELLDSPILQDIFPQLEPHLLLVSSTPIRNMGTLAGNIINASPIGDLTAFFLALDSELTLSNGKSQRNIQLKDFYTGYKQLNKDKDEIIKSIQFKTPNEADYFNFEKVSKRTYLDIATVNTAIKIKTDLKEIQNVHISAGGVGPTPKYLSETRQFLLHKSLSSDIIIEAAQIMDKEISPISDARGTADYKRLLLRQLFYAHFIELFPSIFSIKNLI